MRGQENVLVEANRGPECFFLCDARGSQRLETSAQVGVIGVLVNGRQANPQKSLNLQDFRVRLMWAKKILWLCPIRPGRIGHKADKEGANGLQTREGVSY